MTTLNYRSGISLYFEGQAGADWAQEYFYHDPLADDAKVVYIKDDTAIAMGHNARNKRQTNLASPSYKIIGINGEDADPDSGDEGVIRFFVDEDLNLNLGNGLVGRWADAIEAISGREIISGDLDGGGSFSGTLAPGPNSSPIAGDPDRGKMSLMNGDFQVIDREYRSLLSVEDYGATVPGALLITTTAANNYQAGETIRIHNPGQAYGGLTREILGIVNNTSFYIMGTHVSNATIVGTAQVRLDRMVLANSAETAGEYERVDQTPLTAGSGFTGLISGTIDEDGNVSITSQAGFTSHGRNLLVNCIFYRGQKYPAYEGPFTFGGLTYRDGTTPVVGTTGPTGDITDRSNYWRGVEDDFGDEWHTLTYADDDSFFRYNPDGPFTGSHWEKIASDGKHLLFVVNPKTPCIQLTATDAGQFYTTPAKAWNIPKVHGQTSYVTDDVTINLVNIMSEAACYYRFYPKGSPAGSYIQFTEQAMASSVAALTDATEYTLEYYYDSAFKKTRTIVKNPNFPSGGETHGYMMWRTDAEFNAIVARITNSEGIYDYWYNFLRNRRDCLQQEEQDTDGRQGLRRTPTQAAANAFFAKVLGWDAYANATPDNKSYAAYAKEMLIDSGLNISPLWFGDPVNSPNPSHELQYRGYWDVAPVMNAALAYDLLIAHYRSDQHANGITPIEDYFIRDSLARWSMQAMMETGRFGHLGYVSNRQGMWASARGMGALLAGIAMPSYTTPYYGTSGFDGVTSASYEWTPFRDYPLTWKQVFLTPWLDPAERDTLTLHGFPNLGLSATQETGGLPLILEVEGIHAGRTCYPGDFANRVAYTSYSMMGSPMMILANVVKITQDVSLPFMDLMFERAAEGVLQGAQQDEGMIYASYILTVNEYFSSGDQDSVAAKQQSRMDSLPSSDVSSTEGQMTRNGFYPLVWYRDDWSGYFFSATVFLLSKSESSVQLKSTVSGGTGNVTLQWQKWNTGTSEWDDIDGATSATLTDTDLTPDTTYSYRVVAADESDPAEEVTAEIEVTTLAPALPSLYVLNIGQNIEVSGSTPVEGNLYEAGSIVTLTINEPRNAIFTGWYGDVSGTRKQIQIEMNTARNIQAGFTVACVKSVNIQNLSLITKTPIEV